MGVSQEAEQEQWGLRGLLVGRLALVRVCTEWLETRWESNPLGKCWAGGSSIRAEDQMELNISAEARVGKLMATRDEMTSPGYDAAQAPAA